MSHTNSTTNYSLPQFVTTDKPAWLTDVNTAYSAIDTGMHNAQTKADTADTNASQALLDAASAASAASAADAKGAGAVASIADTFQTTETYAQGELVIYNNLLYVCTVAVETPGSWTGSTNWSRATIEGFVNGKTGADIPLNSSVGSPTIEETVTAVITTNVSTTGYSSSGIDLVRAGKTVQFCLTGITTLPVGGWTQIATLPSNYRPKISFRYDIKARTGQDVRFKLDNDGKVYLYNYGTAITTDWNTYVLFSYICP